MKKNRPSKTAALRAALAGRRLSFDALRADVENRLRQVVGRQRLKNLITMTKDIRHDGKPWPERVFWLEGQG